jgi:hypothetical protein
MTWFHLAPRPNDAFAGAEVKQMKRTQKNRSAPPSPQYVPGLLPGFQPGRRTNRTPERQSAVIPGPSTCNLPVDDPDPPRVATR